MTPDQADKITFTITCTMRRRWVAHFLGLLKCMQSLGSIGASRIVSFYADGDFNPRFEWDGLLPVAKARKENFFDAG